MAAALFVSSCDQILKDRKRDEVDVNTTGKNVVLGTVKDAHGCVTSAGYRWSKLRKDCIRPIEEGYRLNTIDELKDESAVTSAFVVFEADGGDKAELFLPETDDPILLERDGKNAPYKNKHWLLEQQKKYSLKKDGQLLYAGAEIPEGQITGDDREEQQ